jgi:hypothetical protein
MFFCGGEFGDKTASAVPLRVAEAGFHAFAMERADLKRLAPFCYGIETISVVPLLFADRMSALPVKRVFFI